MADVEKWEQSCASLYFLVRLNLEKNTNNDLNEMGSRDRGLNILSRPLEFALHFACLLFSKFRRDFTKIRRSLKKDARKPPVAILGNNAVSLFSQIR